MKCGWSKINDHKIAIIASNGVIFSESAKKATQFVQLANKNNIPILFIHNTTGFMVGKRHEQKWNGKPWRSINTCCVRK